jgi:hypothetical protein
MFEPKEMWFQQELRSLVEVTLSIFAQFSLSLELAPGRPANAEPVAVASSGQSLCHS